MKVQCEWGPEGARRLDGSVGALIVVDVLSFSTCVDVACARGAVVHPFPYGDLAAASAVADMLGGKVAGPRGSAAYPYSLSPVSLAAIVPGTRLVLPSPNGSAISSAPRTSPVLAGCLRNAKAVAERAAGLACGGPVAVIPAGERWPDGSLRPAIEDLIGAGAIIHALEADCSPEAEVALAAFRHALPRLDAIIQGSVSGQELTGLGHAADVEAALAYNVSTAAPLLHEGAYRR